MILCETHANEIQRSGGLSDLRVAWGMPVSSYCSADLGLPCKGAAVWGAMQVKILENDPLFPFWSTGRLALFHVVIADGHTSFLVCAVHGVLEPCWRSS